MLKFFRSGLNLYCLFTWAVLFIFLGYSIGRGYFFFLNYFNKPIFVLFFLVLAAVYVYAFLKVVKKNYLHKRIIYLLFLNVFSLFVFLRMAHSIVFGGFISRLDSLVSLSMPGLWRPYVNKTMIFITNFASPLVLFLISIALFAVLIYKKKRGYSFLILFSMVFGLLSSYLVKRIVRRIRPEEPLFFASGYSFPSGHAAASIIFFSFLIYAFRKEIKSDFLRSLFTAGCIISFLLVGASRIYLNVHWFSDVVAGFSLGLFWITFFDLIKASWKGFINLK